MEDSSRRVVEVKVRGDDDVDGGWLMLLLIDVHRFLLFLTLNTAVTFHWGLRAVCVGCEVISGCEMIPSLS